MTPTSTSSTKNCIEKASNCDVWQESALGFYFNSIQFSIQPFLLHCDAVLFYLFSIFWHCPEADLDGGTCGAPRPPLPFFCNHLFFCDHFEELQTVLIKVKLIINNAPLTYVYPNTIKTYLIPNHLLFDRQLLCYSNTTSAVARNLTVLSSTTDKINRITNHFAYRWRHKYVANLCETQRASKLDMNSQKIMLC